MKGGKPIARPMLMAACAVVLAACCPGEEVDQRGWPNELVLGLVPALEAEALVDNLDPLADYLEAELGVPVRTFVPQDYTGLVEALGAGRADIGMLPPFAAMLGQRRYDLEPILISTRKGEVGYRTQWMTNDPTVCDGDVVIEERLCETRVRGRDAVTRNFASCEGDIRQVRGESVAFVDPNSTIFTSSGTAADRSIPFRSRLATRIMFWRDCSFTASPPVRSRTPVCSPK